jgi:CRISPR/Cas system-associated endonuclease Cas1
MKSQLKDLKDLQKETNENVAADKERLAIMKTELQQAASLLKTFQKSIPSDGKLKLDTAKRSEIIDEMNTCVDACTECLSEDLENEEVKFLNNFFLNFIILI